MTDKQKKMLRDLGKAFLQATYCVGTAAATAAVLWWFLPLWLAVCSLLVVISHEFGHYFSAILQKDVAYLPFFLHIIIGVLGGTFVDDTPEHALRNALAGPAVGMLVALAIAVGAALAGFWPAFWAALWMLIFQLYSATLGGDGRKYRRFKRAYAEAQGTRS